jgi:hypothetical protein
MSQVVWMLASPTLMAIHCRRLHSWEERPAFRWNLDGYETNMESLFLRNSQNEL